jgi:hypothetical protein
MSVTSMVYLPDPLLVAVISPIPGGLGLLAQTGVLVVLRMHNKFVQQLHCSSIMPWSERRRPTHGSHTPFFFTQLQAGRGVGRATGIKQPAHKHSELAAATAAMQPYGAVHKSGLPPSLLREQHSAAVP